MRRMARQAKRLGVLFSVSLAMAGAAACNGRAAGDGSGADTVGASAEPVRAGCQGGFTGGGNGVRIDGDDHVILWSKQTFAAAVEETDTGPDPTLAAEARQRLDAADFTTIAFDEPGNMTCFVTYRGHTVAWPIGDARAPAEVVAVHGRLTGPR